MIYSDLFFAQSEAPANGIGAFNINLKSFVFQLVTFLIVLVVFRRWILPPILKTLEERRQTVEQSLEQAKETEQKLAKAEERAQSILHQARQQADKSLSEAKSQAKDVIAKAEAAADTQAKRIIQETGERLTQEHKKLHDQLRGELTDLVVLTTEKVLAAKINEREDRRLVENALKELARD